MTEAKKELLARYHASRIKESTIDELIGLIRGILADGDVNENECVYLIGWLERNACSLERYPFKELYQLLTSAMSHGQISSDDELEIIKLMISITGSPVVEPNDMRRSAPALPLTENKLESLEGMSICLTGEFECGKRKEIADNMITKGAQFSKSVTMKIDALVIGSVGSEFWKHSSFGNKIKKVLELNSENQLGIIIADESQLTALLDG